MTSAAVVAKRNLANNHCSSKSPKHTPETPAKTSQPGFLSGGSRTKTIGKFSLPLLLSLWACHLFALDPKRHISQYIHEYWTAEKGLPQSFVSAMIQDPDGYLWVNTQQGLCRFDGITFQPINRWNTPVFEKFGTVSAFFAHGQSLWLGGGSGTLLEKADKNWIPHTFDSIANTTINGFCASSNAGDFWLKTADKLFRMRGDTCEPIKELDGRTFSRIDFMVAGSEGPSWIVTDGGIFKQDGGLFRIQYPANFLPANATAFLVDSRQTLWVGTANTGLSHYDGKKWRPLANNSKLLQANIRALYEDKDGNLWIGTYGSGIFRITDGTIESFASEDGLSNDEVTSFCEDREGSLWIATKNGLNRLKDANVTCFGKKEGIPSEFVWSVYEDPSGVIWLGTVYSGLFMLKDERLSAFPYNSQLPHTTIRTTYRDRRGNLLIGTMDGLAVLEDGRIRVLGKNEGLANSTVRVIFEDSRDRLWIGTSGGLFLRQKDRFEPYAFQKDAPTSMVFHMLEESDGSLLVAGTGLTRISDSGNQRIAWEQGLDTTVFSVARASDGSLVMATAKGLARLKNGKLGLYGAKEGLADTVSYNAVEDREKSVWVTTIRGLYRVTLSDLDAFDAGSISSLKPEVFGVMDGMRSPEGVGGAQTAGFLSRDGKLWFPSLKGVYMIDPGNIRKNGVPPPVLVEGMTADHAPVATDGYRLHPGTRNLEFRYTALSLIAPQKNQFKYKLENYDQDWIDAGNRRVAYYTNLAKGDYVFHVIASNNDGVWNTTGASFAFSIAPHFYQTWWFYTLCTLAAGGVLLGSHRLRMMQLKARAQELTLLVEERTRDLKESQRRLLVSEKMASLGRITAGIAHEMNTPLAAVRAALSESIKLAEEAQSSIDDPNVTPEDHQEIVKEQLYSLHLAEVAAARASEFVHGIKAQTRGMSIQGAIKFDAVSAIDEALLLLTHLLRKANCTVSFNHPKSLEIAAQPGHLAQIVTNLMTNAIEASVPKGGGAIEISLTRDVEQVFLVVKDQGCGIEEAHLDLIFEPMFTTKPFGQSTGLGLSIVHDIVYGELGGTISATSQVNQGSTFTVTFPRFRETV